MSNYPIRHAREQDSAEITRLASQLGYPATLEAMTTRLQRLLASPNDVVFVAQGADGQLVGWIHGFLSQLLESDYRVEIGGLVVDEHFHRQGVGCDLVCQAEEWATQHGVEQVSVRCRTTRAEAHIFYETLGYSRTKTQIVFQKYLSQPPKAG